MNKNLENEYKDLMSTEIPDLWDRIEKALPEKTVSSVNAETGSNEINVVSFETHKKTKFNPAIWSAVLVACICGLVAIPVVLFNGRAKNYESSAESAGAAEYIGINKDESSPASEDFASDSFDSDSYNEVNGMGASSEETCDSMEPGESAVVADSDCSNMESYLIETYENEIEYCSMLTSDADKINELHDWILENVNYDKETMGGLEDTYEILSEDNAGIKEMCELMADSLKSVDVKAVVVSSSDNTYYYVEAYSSDNGNLITYTIDMNPSSDEWLAVDAQDESVEMSSKESK